MSEKTLVRNYADLSWTILLPPISRVTLVSYLSELQFSLPVK